MNARLFILDDHCRANTNFSCYYAYGKNQVSDLHYHNYYEVFITITDKLVHFVNGVRQVLPAGTLAFIRPNDRHHFCFEPGEDSRHINLSFNERILNLLFSYLADADFLTDDLLTCPMPPMHQLNARESKKVIERLYEFNNSFDDKITIDLKMRLLLAELFVKYFSNFNHVSNLDNVPQWFQYTCEQMKKYDNFIEGVEKMIKISGKSREHLYRSVQKYLGVPVSEYINTLRLNYAASMLINSSLPIIDVCFESGFQNLGYFYSLFNKKFGMSPKQYKNRSRTNPDNTRSVIIDK